MSLRLGVLTTHPIQYYAAWFRQLAGCLNLEVFYAFRQDAEGQAQAGFGVEFEWDTPLLEGYRFRWLHNVARRPGLGTFSGCDTPELISLLPGRLDALLIFGWNYKSAWQGIRSSRQAGIPVLMRGDSILSTDRPWWKQVLKALPYRLWLPRLDAHLYVGKRNRDYLQHYGVSDSRLFFCPHSVDNSYFAERAKHAEETGESHQIRKDLGIPQEDFVALFAGKLIAKKRPADMVEAFQRLERQGERCLWLLVVGSGPLEGNLRQLATNSQRILFLGFQNQSRMPAYYRAADVLLLPSESETWGLVVNEAMATGMPAIVSDRVGCAPDLIEEDCTGLTYPCGSVDRLAQSVLTMRDLLRNRRQQLRLAVSEKIRGYSLESSTKGLLQALKDIAGRS